MKVTYMEEGKRGVPDGLQLLPSRLKDNSRRQDPMKEFRWKLYQRNESEALQKDALRSLARAKAFLE